MKEKTNLWNKEDVCEWLSANLYLYTYNDPVYEEYINTDKVIEDLKAAMEG